MKKLETNYLFPEINLRKHDFLSRNPHAQLISLGIGDTTEPIPPYITQALTDGASRLGTRAGYTGYGSEQGLPALRKIITEQFYPNRINHDEVFISDGTKCDLGRLQALFGSDVSIAVQNPTYPVYVDGSLIHGVSNIVYMPSNPENNFFPDLEKIPRTDLIYFCSPNNPTGAAATKNQLEKLIAFAKTNHSVIIYDAAYANYIKDPLLPKSIYEIEGAREVAIELGSFSKMAGFTGVRLGWSVVPDELTYDDGFPIRKDWGRVHSTIFNGASNIAQAGGCAVLEEEGLKEIAVLIEYYLENAKILRSTMEELGYEIYGGINAPFLWVRFSGKSSWHSFQDFLDKYHIITTPGLGFGVEGEHFLRLAAFSHRENILLAVKRLRPIR